MKPEELDEEELDEEDALEEALDEEEPDEPPDEEPPLPDCWPTSPLIVDTTPATGAVKVVSVSSFCADVSCACADTTDACACASCSGFGGSSFTALFTSVDWYCVCADVS